MRKINDEVMSEHDELRVTFKLEKSVYILHALISLLGFIPIFTGLYAYNNLQRGKIFGIIFFCAGGLTIVLSLLLLVFRIMSSLSNSLTISNKRVYGKYGDYLIRRNISLKIDNINDVEATESLKAKSIVIEMKQKAAPNQFNKNKFFRVETPTAPNEVFKFRAISNCDEVLEKLTQLIHANKTNSFSSKQLDEGINKQKEEAIEKMTKKLTGVASAVAASSTDYIDEIKKLKELLDSGAITKEEYDQEKKEILESNHNNAKN